MTTLPLLTAGLIISFMNIKEASGQSADQTTGRLSPKEFTIPPSPVFDLMGVTSSQINRISGVKDFKVDWSFKSWKINPNLAIQAQPFWEAFYSRKDLTKYQSASGFMRRLSSMDLSVGTVQDETGDRRIGFAAKMNILNQRDPLLAKELYAGIDEKYNFEKKEIQKQIDELRSRLDTTTNILDKPKLRTQIGQLQGQLTTLSQTRQDEINARAKIYVEENWNASSVDIAIGKIYSYKTDSAGSLKSLRLNRNTGFSAWLNGSVKLGKKFLISGLFRSSWYDEELEFFIKDISNGSESSQKAIAQNTLFTMGTNIRYGSSIYTFFVEFLYEKKGLKTPMEALNDAFKTPANFQVVTSSVKWDIVHPNTLSFGGDWRLSRSVILNYGMRCIFSKDWKFKTFTPVATISCMMR